MADVEEVLLEDTLHKKDLQIRTGTGDIDTIRGLDNVKDAIIRRIMTRPGSLVHRPDYGAGLIDFQGAPLTLATKQEIASRISNNLKRDPRVVSLKGVLFNYEDRSPERVTITIKAEILGYGETVLEFAPFQEVF